MSRFYAEGAQFMVGHTFDTEYGHHEYGTVFKEADKIPNLDVLVSAGWLYPFVPDEGYAQLPSHLFSYVMNQAEAEAKIRGDKSLRVSQYQGEDKPEVVKQAEQEAEQQPAFRRMVVEAANAQRQENKTPPSQVPTARPLDEQLEKKAVKPPV